MYGQDQQGSLGFGGGVAMPPAQQVTGLSPMPALGGQGQQGQQGQNPSVMGGLNNMVQALMGGYKKSQNGQATPGTDPSAVAAAPAAPGAPLDLTAPNPGPGVPPQAPLDPNGNPVLPNQMLPPSGNLMSPDAISQALFSPQTSGANMFGGQIY